MGANKLLLIEKWHVSSADPWNYVVTWSQTKGCRKRTAIERIIFVPIHCQWIGAGHNCIYQEVSKGSYRSLDER